MSFVVIIVLAIVATVTGLIGQGNNSIAAVCAVIFLISSVCLYLSPAMVAAMRGHKNTASIIVLDILLGWTVIGWVGALVWAYSANTEKEASGSQVQSEPAIKYCPQCAEKIMFAAVKCRYCQADLSSK